MTINQFYDWIIGCCKKRKKNDEVPAKVEGDKKMDEGVDIKIELPVGEEPTGGTSGGAGDSTQKNGNEGKDNKGGKDDQDGNGENGGGPGLSSLLTLKDWEKGCFGSGVITSDRAKIGGKDKGKSNMKGINQVDFTSFLLLCFFNLVAGFLNLVWFPGEVASPLIIVGGHQLYIFFFSLNVTRREAYLF